MISEKIVQPYNLTLELDRIFGKTSEGQFSNKEFSDVLHTFAAIDSHDDQIKCFDLYKTLPKSDVVKRTIKVAKLTSLADKISHNKRKL